MALPSPGDLLPTDSDRMHCGHNSNDDDNMLDDDNHYFVKLEGLVFDARYYDSCVSNE